VAGASPHGVRSLSAVHREDPFRVEIGGQAYSVEYAAGDSPCWMFGGNSNWRGPIWFPINYLLLEALERYHHFYGDTFAIECPTGSGARMNLDEVARELSRRLAKLFLPDASGARPCHGGRRLHGADPHWKDLVLFHEYFHGDDGRWPGRLSSDRLGSRPPLHRRPRRAIPPSKFRLRGSLDARKEESEGAATFS
jgi:hypothetical protein